MQEKKYEQMLEFVHSLPWMGKKLGLRQISDLLRRMGNPQDKLKYIHVAGTNGKGSTSEMLARVLEAAGYKTGLFVSPYIQRFNERIQVNHRPIADDVLADLIEQTKIYAEQMEVMPSEFELVTAVGFQYFLDMNCDIVVLEVGMGGRLDATNIVKTPEAAVITTIGLDHTQYLGGTIREIALEKAGIIKRDGDVVVYGQDGDAIDVFKEVCEERSANLNISDFSEIVRQGESDDYQYFSYKGSDVLALPLLGEHQLKNAATALETVFLINRKGFEISDFAIKTGLCSVAWPGRFEFLSKDPPVVVDGGHNPEGARAAVDAFKYHFPGKKAIILIGLTAEKDVDGLCRIIDEIASSYIVIQAENNPRSMKKDVLADLLGGYKKVVFAADTVAGGIEMALGIRSDDEIVFSIGSLYTVAEVRKYFKKS